jgi:RNA polymerase primary sigma factor
MAITTWPARSLDRGEHLLDLRRLQFLDRLGFDLANPLAGDRQSVAPDAHVHRTELTRELDRILGTLTPREQTVIRLRFGIGQDEPCTLEQVGQSLSVTRERIRQIEAKAIKKLKTPEIKEMFAAIK